MVATAQAQPLYASPIPRAVVAAMLLAVRLAGLSPLGFFVSFGGYLWFVALAWVAAAVVRGISFVTGTKSSRF